MNTRSIKITLFFSTILIGVITSIHPLYPEMLFLHHTGTALLLIPLILDLRSNSLSLWAFTCFIIFILFHIIGVRYTYSYVPYNEWCTSIFGTDLNSFFQTPRNHYDRFVHFIFGLLTFPYIYEIIRKKIIISKLTALILAWAIIQTGSMLYELFEWGLALIMSPDAVENYNGQQGDIWDAHKDMALACLGSLLMLLIYLIQREKKE